MCINNPETARALEPLPDQPNQNISLAINVPTNVNASDGIYADKVNVTWSTVPGVSTYRVYRAENRSRTRILLGKVRFENAFEDKNANPGVTYRYWIRACTGTACSGFSRLNTGWRLSNIPTTLAPTGLISNTRPIYVWSKVDGATQYQFQVLQGTKVIHSLRILSGKCENTVNCTSRPRWVLENSTYTWKVRAMLNGAWMPFSAENTFTMSRE